jgi:hypothetical protein
MVNGYLKIHQVSQRDAGTYVCKVVIKTMSDNVCQIQTKAKLVVFEDLSESKFPVKTVQNDSRPVNP